MAPVVGLEPTMHKVRWVNSPLDLPILPHRNNSLMAGQVGFEPTIYSATNLYWSGRPGSNRRPHGPKPCALPPELLPVNFIHNNLIKLVAVSGARIHQITGYEPVD